MIDVFGLGNAIVDTEVDVDDTFLHDQEIAKGHMTLIDSSRMQELLIALDGQPLRRCSGGSAANTTYAVQAFGHRTSYGCKVSDDEVGRFFLTDMAGAGVRLSPKAASSGDHSGQCLVMITPDAERTMTTDLGISNSLSVDEVNFDDVKSARYFYVEGYLSSSPTASAAAVRARELSEEHRIATAISLSDPSMVEFFRDPLTSMLGNGVSVLFCNEEEALNWAGTDRIDVATAELKDIGETVFVTLGAAGSLAIHHGQAREVAGVAARAQDTTGAGDMYAGAALAALCDGAEPAEAARFGNHCAARLVEHIGARLPGADAYQALRQSFN